MKQRASTKQTAVCIWGRLNVSSAGAKNSEAETCIVTRPGGGGWFFPLSIMHRQLVSIEFKWEYALIFIESFGQNQTDFFFKNLFAGLELLLVMEGNNDARAMMILDEETGATLTSTPANNLYKQRECVSSNEHEKIRWPSLCTFIFSRPIEAWMLPRIAPQLPSKGLQSWTFLVTCVVEEFSCSLWQISGRNFEKPTLFLKCWCQKIGESTTFPMSRGLHRREITVTNTWDRCVIWRTVWINLNFELGPFGQSGIYIPVHVASREK